MISPRSSSRDRCGRPTLWLATSRFLSRSAGYFAAIAAVLFLSDADCRAAIRAEAYRGVPFGMGRITVDLPPGASATPASDDRFGVSESSGRVLYPVTENAPARRILRRFLGIETPWRITIDFMFRGDEPLDLVLYAPDAERLTIRPENDPQEFNELLDDWWDATKDRFQEVYRQAEYPVVVENYLAATWARRLSREMPEPRKYLLRPIEWGNPWISELLANEAYQNDIERALLLDRSSRNESPTVSLPVRASHEVAASVPPPKSEDLPAPDGAAIASLPEMLEPIAGHVPRECFYLRFGNFQNYLWFRDFLHHAQGDLANMIVQRSVDHNDSERFQQQIAVGETETARVMGPRVIRDVAIIGFDPYERDGAAMGILFQANVSALLSNNLNEQRHKAMAAHHGATEATVKIAGHDVSYIDSPTGRLRSYYAIDGDFHLVTTCRRLVERFYEAAAGGSSLAASDDFQSARAAMPLEREDTVFLFTSSAFFENLTSPHYRIELDRRLRSIGEMRVLELARLAAQAEGRDATTVGQLIDADLLPAGFGRHADGCQLIESEGGLRDSLRGQRGSMLPIPDVPVGKITPAEAARYDEFQRNLRSQVGQFVPLSVAVKRASSPEKQQWDRITADVRLADYSQTRFASFMRLLGPASRTRVAPVAGDIVSVEAILDALGQGVHLFGGLRDFHTPLLVREGGVQADASPAEFIRGYVGAFPRPHLLDGILGRPTGPFDEQGIARNNRLFDLWLRRANDFFLFSFKRDVLLEVGPQLAMVEAERPAQIRVRVDDLSDKQLSMAVTGLAYMRARATSSSGARFMNSLATQLHVPPDAARDVAEELVGGTFQCPLGGELVLADPSAGQFSRAAGQSENDGDELPPPRQPPVDGSSTPVTVTSPRKLWVSTAVPPANRFLLTEIPADYQMPLMDWFRGITTDMARVDDELRAHAELDMVHLDVSPEPTESGEGFELPNLSNLFGGFGISRDDKVKPASVDEDLPRPTSK